MLSDLDYVIDLGRKEFEAIGFVPRPALEEAERSGQLWMQRENGEPCGYLYFGNGWPTLRIYQACIQYDARRREHGFALVRRLIAHADAGGYNAISLWCANDLDANDFWKSCGFTFAQQRDGGTKRGRKHNQWVLWMPRPLQSELWESKRADLPEMERT